MGDIADMMLDGTLCEGCGVYVDDETTGYPRRCAACRVALREHGAFPKNPHRCPVCGKALKNWHGVLAHGEAVHAKNAEHIARIRAEIGPLAALSQGRAQR